MLRRSATLGLVAAIVLVLLTVPATTASAATCIKWNPAHTACWVYLELPPQQGEEDSSDESTSQVGESKCTWEGVEIPCYREGLGRFVSSRGCYMRKLTAAQLASQPEVAAQAAQNRGKSAYLCRTILSTNNGEPILEPGEIVWADDLTVTITPEQAARAVLATMDFHPIDLGISQKMSGPQGVGYVGVPVWMWAKGGATEVGPQHKSATYAGIAVSLDATMDKVVWNLGDGDKVTCGRGTPYRAEIGYADSPTCGHRYQRISKDQPGGAYRVSATSHWDVAWAAGGETGSVPLTFTTATSLQVGEIQVVVTRG